MTGRTSRCSKDQVRAAAACAIETLESRRLLAAVDLIEIGAFSAAPGQAQKLGAQTLFSTYDRTVGQMLWTTDGTQAGTRLVKDIDPETSTPSTWFISGRDNSIVIGDTLYFTAVDNAHGRELWKSNGTPEGTQMVRDIVAGPGDSNPEGFTVVNGQLLFTANQKIWKSDGTADGTQQVRGVDPLGFADGERMAVMNGELYFTTYPAIAPYFGSNNTGQLWKTNGTASGTDLVADVNGQNDFTDGIGPNMDLVNVNGTLYFAANDGQHGFELWKSNGTPQGTTMVADITAGAGSSSPADLVDFNGTLFFAAAGSLWKSNGTAQGTIRISNATHPSELYVVNGSLYFSSDTGSTGRELWISDGTAANTHLVKNIHPDVVSGSDSNPDSFLRAGGHLFFRADDGTHGLELWHSDGTNVGTSLIADLETAGSSAAMPFGVGGNRVMVSARESDTARWHIYSVQIPTPSRPRVIKLHNSVDTGIDHTDRVTRNNQPRVTGDAMPDSLVRLFDDGVEIGSAIAVGGFYSITPTSTLPEGKHTFTVTAADDEGQWSEPSPALSVRIDRSTPDVRMLQASAQSVVLKFSENVSQTLSTDDLQIQNMSTNQVFVRSAMNVVYDDKTNTATITFPGFGGAILPPARYILTLNGKGVTDTAGNRVVRKPTFEFVASVSASEAKKSWQLVGTTGDDEIIVRLKSGSPKVLQVLMNGKATERPLQQLSYLRVDGAAGDDMILLDNTNGDLQIATRLYGGAGKDTIQGGNGPDRIYGGTGNDVLRGGAGRDILYGENGNDDLLGENGDDYLFGGLGPDRLQGNSGHDRIFHDATDHLQTDQDDLLINQNDASA